MNQQQADNKYLRMAHIWAENSTARRLHVGALIVKGRSIISDGFNGTPSGFDNNCEEILCSKEGMCEYAPFLTKEVVKTYASCSGCKHFGMVTKPEVLHAEANAITKLARSTQSSEGATIYITDSPCLQCAKLIIQAGIKRVVFDRSYRNTEGIELLQKAGIEVCCIPIT